MSTDYDLHDDYQWATEVLNDNTNTEKNKRSWITIILIIVFVIIVIFIVYYLWPTSKPVPMNALDQINTQMMQDPDAFESLYECAMNRHNSSSRSFDKSRGHSTSQPRKNNPPRRNNPPRTTHPMYSSSHSSRSNQLSPYKQSSNVPISPGTQHQEKPSTQSPPMNTSSSKSTGPMHAE